jgi:hypothetical protein
MKQEEYNLMNFNSREDFDKYFNAKTLKERSSKFKWLRVKFGLKPSPEYAIKGMFYYFKIPEVKELKE